MQRTSSFPFRAVFFSSSAMKEVPDPIRRFTRQLLDSPHLLNADVTRSLVVTSASDIVLDNSAKLPPWIDVDTFYLIVSDIPEPALMRLPTALRIHKPDQRIHVTRDSDVVKRMAIALGRDIPLEGIVDAYLLGNDLLVVLGDMSIRSFPVHHLELFSKLDKDMLSRFEVHTSGSYLWWPDLDFRVGASELLQAADPTYLADVIISRYAIEKMSLALRILREDRGLTQSQIGGLSDRHIRRLENEEVRLTSDAAEKYSVAFGMDVADFLALLGRLLADLRDEAPKADWSLRSDPAERLRHVS